MLKNRIKNSIYFFTFILTLVSINFAIAQSDIPPKPKLQTSVYDYANLLNASQKAALENKLIKYNDSTSTQIVVATVKTIHGKNIALYATEWAHKWGFGDAKKDNGVFVLVASEDRKLTIRTGYGVEHLLTDAYSRRIIEQVIKPEFKRGNFYAGLNKGTSYIIKALNGEFKANPQQAEGEFPIEVIIFLIFFVIILIIILSNKNHGNGGNYRRDTTGSILETIILSNRGRGGFSGGGFGGGFGGGSSGGFGGGFGGGGFGGGGASGGW